jgi:mutator protein MutT
VNYRSVKAIDVAAGVIFSRGKILITQRCADQHLGNLWEFPGGKVENGESFEDCLKREIREELGIEISVGELVEDLTHEYPEKTVRLRFYRCALVSGDPRAIHCQDWRWVAPGELKGFEFPAADGRLIQRLERE